MHSDPIADFLNRIKNASKAYKTEVAIPYSKMKEEIAKILTSEKFINSYKIDTSEKFPRILVALNEVNRNINLKRISKPGQRIYIKAQEIKKIRNGFGISIVSTSKGIITGKEARKQKLGGELLCEVY
jgi:small subunit ribosomal protein S8